MDTIRKILIMLLAVSASFGLWKVIDAAGRSKTAVTYLVNSRGEDKKMTMKIQKSNEEWQKILTPEQFRILRLGETEKPYSGEYNDFWDEGTYLCAACETPLFSSVDKYEHGTGWPSFKAAINNDHLEYRQDNSHFMRRTEVRCAVCGSHLGHVFDDGPPPAGIHYCINSAALRFLPASRPHPSPEARDEEPDESNPDRTAIFAAGCFWGVERNFSRIKGVTFTEVGYTGGNTASPTYEQVRTGMTGHAESIRIKFDPLIISYEELVRHFFEMHDPTQVNRQGPDHGTQYRSAVFYLTGQQRQIALKVMDELAKSGKYKKPLATEVSPAGEFYRAEEYHQKYFQKRDRDGSR